MTDEDYLISPDYEVIEASEAALASEGSELWTALNYTVCLNSRRSEWPRAGRACCAGLLRFAACGPIGHEAGRMLGRRAQPLTGR